MLNIRILTKPHSQQRYDTVGDWTFSGNYIFIYVSEMGDWKKEALVAVHELLEAILCKARDIPEHIVSEFDINFERDRKPEDISEPGDALNAPYKNEHFFATSIERLLCAELKVEWSEYDETIQGLS